MDIGFYDGSGTKIRKIVDVVYLIVIVLHVVAAVALLIVAIVDAAFGIFFLGLIALAISLGVLYVSMLKLAAFAELVENSQSILDELRNKKRTVVNSTVINESGSVVYEPPKKPVKREEPKVVKKEAEGVKTISCPKCGKSQFESRSTCFSCGAALK